jgi:long-chain fatty acid transport protein
MGSRNMKNKILVLAVAALFTPLAQATTFGTDVNNSVLPATGGMGGASVARTVEGAAAVFGNPANLTQYKEGTTFTFGASFFDPKIEVEHAGGLLGATVPWEGTSNADKYLIPTVSVTQGLGGIGFENLVLGMGLTATGAGSDFRDTPGSLGANGEVIIFMANVGVGYQVTDALSLGFMATIGNGYAQASLNGDSSSAHNFGLRATLGATYDVGATSFGAYYRSPLKITYEDYIAKGVPSPGSNSASSPGAEGFWDDAWQQPQEFAVGISNNSLMGGDLLISADLIHKDYSGADFYKDFFRDQTVFALGGQLTTGKAQWRLGYTHARDPIKRNLNPGTIGIGNNNVIDSPLGQIPVTGAVVEFFQATNAGAVWEHSLSAGVGYQVLPMLRVDVHGAFAPSEKLQIGLNKVTAENWQAGVGFTWNFK